MQSLCAADSLNVNNISCSLSLLVTEHRLIIKENGGAGEMAQWLRALDALPEDPGSIPSTHMAVHNCLQFQAI